MEDTYRKAFQVISTTRLDVDPACLSILAFEFTNTLLFQSENTPLFQSENPLQVIINLSDYCDGKCRLHRLQLLQDLGHVFSGDVDERNIQLWRQIQFYGFPLDTFRSAFV
jgi:hypothetical protein